MHLCVYVEGQRFMTINWYHVACPLHCACVLWHLAMMAHALAILFTFRMHVCINCMCLSWPCNTELEYTYYISAQIVACTYVAHYWKWMWWHNYVTACRIATQVVHEKNRPAELLICLMMLMKNECFQHSLPGGSWSPCSNQVCSSEEESCPLDLKIDPRWDGQMKKTPRTPPKTYPSSLLWAQFKAQRNHVVSLQEQAKKEYFLCLIFTKTRPTTLHVEIT